MDFAHRPHRFSKREGLMPLATVATDAREMPAALLFFMAAVRRCRRAARPRGRRVPPGPDIPFPLPDELDAVHPGHVDVTEHPVDVGGADGHDVGVEHHEGRPPIALQRVLGMEVEDRLLPVLQPPVARYGHHRPTSWIARAVSAVASAPPNAARTGTRATGPQKALACASR